MKLHFHKFDGAGNDFILVDTRGQDLQLTPEQVAHLCHRRFGIGADGLMTLSDDPSGSDFLMRYYNSDGHEATMCGNGGRCIAAFAHLLGLPTLSLAKGRGVPVALRARPCAQKGGRGSSTLNFNGPDGLHQAIILLWDEERRLGLVDLTMRPVACNTIRREPEGWFLDTGSPHLVVRVDDLEHYDVVGEGRRLRNLTDRWPEGTNVDFIEDAPDGSLTVRTYERGVEDETLACGTGVTACAIVTGNQRIHARGGDFKVTFKSTGTSYEDIHLIGPVSLNFEGDVQIEN